MCVCVCVCVCCVVPEAVSRERGALCVYVCVVLCRNVRVGMCVDLGGCEQCVEHGVRCMVC